MTAKRVTQQQQKQIKKLNVNEAAQRRKVYAQWHGKSKQAAK